MIIYLMNIVSANGQGYLNLMRFFFLDKKRYSTFQDMKEVVPDTKKLEKVCITSNGNNCGGRCRILVHLIDGLMTRITSENLCDEIEGQPSLKACARGRNYRNLVYHPDRLKTPMKRVGKRGSGSFVPITWEEAIQTIAKETKRIGDTYGPASRYIPYGWGNAHGVLSDQAMMKKVLALAGGYLNYWGDYGCIQTQVATKSMYGTSESGNSYSTLVDSKLIILMAHNPASTVFGTTFRHYLMKARENGTKIIVVDPRYTETAQGLADEWIPIRPTTDPALMDAMAYVILKRRLYDKEFLNKFCIGFDRVTLPKGIPAKESVKSYLLGKKDGIEKTPEWAEKITGVPANKIIELAVSYAKNKPSALILGLGGQRHAYGEQHPRGGILLACMTGNVGVRGGWASGMGITDGGIHRRFLSPFATVENPVKASIPCFLFTDAILQGSKMGKADGIQGVERLPSNIKAIYNFSGNVLINQHSDINATKKILEDERKVEFIVVCDLFMTTSAKFADILLPGTSFLERDDILKSWANEGYFTVQQKVMDPLYASKDEYEIVSEIARALGVYDEFTEGKTRREWIDAYIELVRKTFDPNFPSFEKLCETGVYFFPEGMQEEIAFQKQIEDPVHYPFETPSGKIELFSMALWALDNHKEIPPIPKYIPAWEGPSDPWREQFPLQLIGYHSIRHTQSMHDNQPWLDEAEKHRLWMNPMDANERKISNGDYVEVFNHRGITRILVLVTQKIIPGVVAMPVGSWEKKDENGIDVSGSINVLTTQRATAWSKGNPQHTILVEVRKCSDKQIEESSCDKNKEDRK